MTATSKDVIENANFIVIKIGSALVRGKELDQANQEWINSLAADIAELRAQGKKVVLVSSGGVALGRKALKIDGTTPPADIPLAKKQAASAVGQYYVFNAYHKALQKHGITTAQVLLTMSETENRRMNLNAREALSTLLDHGIIPVINENDVVSTGEIRFGDNDRLSVRVAQMILADTVILLSTTDGLYTDNPDKNDKAEHIPVIEAITDEHIAMAGDAVPGLSTGGMKSKVEAAISAVKSGINLIITDGRTENPINALVSESIKSSLFCATPNDTNARKTWIGAHMNPKGSATIDAGALTALKNGKSLLPVGITSVTGAFVRGDVIEVKTQDGQKIAMGIAAYSAEDARQIMGKNSSDISDILGYIGRDELIHRNDMVLDI